MPQQGNMETLSSDDVSDEELEKVARIAVKTQMATRKERMQMRKTMKKKYGNPQQMDSTQKAQARREIRKQKMAMQKKSMKVMRQESKNEDMDPKRVQIILRSTQQDSALGKRFKKAAKAAMQNQRPQMGGGQNQGGGSPNQ